MNPAEFANIARSEQRFWWYRGMNLILFQMLDPVARKCSFPRVLEAGCGTGYLAKLLAERYGWRMFPVDLGWEGLQFAKSMEVARISQADIERLPFEDRGFDAVLSMDVVVHFARGQEDRAIRELARVLKPGGFFAVRVSALDILRSRHSEFVRERQRFTRNRLIRVVSDSGIKVERCTYANSLLLPMALAKFRLWEPLISQKAASGVEPVNAVLDKVLFTALRLEAKWLGAGHSFPIGQSLILTGWKR